MPLPRKQGVCTPILLRYSYLEKKERNLQTLPPLGRFTSGVTLILLALTLYGFLQNGVAVLPQIAFLIAVVVKMWWRDPWAGYGAAFVMAAGVGNAVLASFRDGVPRRAAIASAVISAALVVLYWMTGRMLGSVRPWTRGVPWITFAFVLLVFPLVFRAYYTPTGGMEPTILQGDSLLLRRQFGRSPARGEVVVFRYPLDRRQTFVKRVVAVGGDRVRIRDKKLIVNGSELQESYVIRNTPQMLGVRDNFPEQSEFPLPSPEWARLLDAQAGKDITVPDGKLFVLGDNRDASLDSRFWGFVDPADVVGTPVLVYWSLEKRGEPGEPDFPLSKIRWRRVFHPI